MVRENPEEENQKEKEHLSGYQARDYDVVDYAVYQLAGTGLSFRGPEPALKDGGYVSFLGAAQTFGCFCEQPFPRLVGEQLGVTPLNLGYGGAGPRFFNRHPELIEIVNRGRAAVLQVMSGRSEDNHRFESRGLEKLTRRRDGRVFSADQAWRSQLEGGYWWKRSPLGRPLLRRLGRKWARPGVEALVAETRANWCASYEELLSRIRVPVLLLWFSRRRPDYQESTDCLRSLFGEYPQLVNRPMVESLRRRVGGYAECVSERGMPQPLRSRFDGQPVSVDLSKDRDDFQGQVWTHNTYYPSPEMHEDAARLVVEKLPGLLGDH